MQAKTQTFNDGVVSVYSVGNTAAVGDAPQETLSVKATLRYKRRTVGIKRYYTASEANAQIDQLIRCQVVTSVSTQDVAILPDGLQYRITWIQYPEDITPPVMDLTLERLVENYVLS